MKKFLPASFLASLASLPSFATLYTTNWNSGFANGGVVPDDNLSGCYGSRPAVDKLLAGSWLYREVLAEREEIMKLKWCESEPAGHDIGDQSALVSWAVHHRARWQMVRHHS